MQVLVLARRVALLRGALLVCVCVCVGGVSLYSYRPAEEEDITSSCLTAFFYFFYVVHVSYIT